MADGNQQKHLSVTEFCYKSVNLLLEERINIKVIVFLILELFIDSKIPREKSLL